ncbi:hypothetical protein [Actinophytocola sp.]|uniref:hypothetical protein n=1 Tax=Actinophytocola sp. TaxID=1872138 RepID=UPI003D6C3591
MVAEHVHDLFAETLDTPAGQIAQLYVLARLLNRIDGGDHPDLAEPLHLHADSILAG